MFQVLDSGPWDLSIKNVRLYTRPCHTFETTPHIRNKKFWEELIAWFPLIWYRHRKRKKNIGNTDTQASMRSHKSHKPKKNQGIHRQQGDLINLLQFSQNKKRRLQMTTNTLRKHMDIVLDTIHWFTRKWYTHRFGNWFCFHLHIRQRYKT
jgi:hypothetical protein